MARTSHLQAVPDEFKFEQEADPYFDVVNQDTHKFIYRDEETQKNLKQHKYQTKASNEHDHSVAVNFRVPPDIAARMKYLAEHPAIRPSTKSALWRDAGYWYLAFMEKMLNDETFTEDMQLTTQQAEVEYFESVTFQRTHLVESQAAAIQRVADAKDWTRLPAAIAAGHKVVAESTVDTTELERVLREAESRLEQR